MSAADGIRRRHRQRIERYIARLEARSRRFSQARLAAVIAGAVVSIWISRVYGGEAGLLAATIFLLLFLALVKLHDRVDDGVQSALTLRRIRDLHARRRDLDWDAIPDPLDAGADPSHPFASDLTLVGPRSVHHLLDACASKGGSRRLKAWLLETEPDYERCLERQQLVRDLVPLRIFRDHLTRSALVRLHRARWDDADLMTWLSREDVVPRLKPWLIGLGAFAAVNIGLLIGHVAGLVPMLWPATMLIYFALYYTQRRAIHHLFDESQDLELLLTRFSPPLTYLERFRFGPSSAAHGITAPLRASSPSEHLSALRRIAAAAAVTKSELLWLILNALLPWDILFTLLLHRAKRSMREMLPKWLEAWYNLEAASSLAAFAEYRPELIFPVLTPPGEGQIPVFEATGLGHPLLRPDVKVRNDFRLPRLGDVVLITGSNMSGKSTFLRTIGVNVRLALAGAPVDARSLRTTCFRVFTSINVSDSVQDGLSHFYAEVKRLKRLLDALDGSLPLLNLIDEIFRGTNNRERLIGSRAFVRTLAGRRAVSLISTHDLELTQLEGEVAAVSNYHFREDLRGDRMTFDYKLRPGPCPTTNALKIMALAGLPVEPERKEHGV